MKLLALMLSLSFLVLIHEGGHFFFARLFKTRVEKFYLFFNPWFSLLRAKKYEGRWHFSFFSAKSPEEFEKYPDNTEWGIGWLPFGGYCSIAGMIDENNADGSKLSQTVQPWEYRSKKAWQRLLIISGGVLVNFIGALVIYCAIMFTWGTDTLPLQNVPYGYDYNTTAQKYGFRNGDYVLSIDGKQMYEMKDVVGELLLNGGKQVKVLRGQDTVMITLSDKFAKEMVGAGEKQFAVPRFPFVIGSFADNSLGQKAGLRVGDSLVAINDQPTTSFSEFKAKLARYVNAPVVISYYRNNVLDSVKINLGKDGLIGAAPKNFLADVKYDHHSYNLLQSVPKGISYGVETLVSYVKQFKIVFSKEGASQLGGFGSIGSLFPETWDWLRFWTMTAFLSIILAFMNVLPIPALDGGHIVFTLWEMVTGRKPSVKFLEKAQMVGMIILFALLIYANGNDLFRWLTGRM
ncbi:MAG: RIP metalloprotease RseP [Bacteroidales bacterium]|nr:RIP metalloprotease RseP [Bacteroidales bacterium]